MEKVAPQERISMVSARYGTGAPLAALAAPALAAEPGFPTLLGVGVGTTTPVALARPAAAAAGEVVSAG